MFKTLASAAISLAIVFQAANFVPPAHAASCSSVGGQSGRLKHSGLVSGNSAKVCGREIWKLVSAQKPVQKPVETKSPAKRVHWKNEFSVSPDRPRVGVTGSLSLSANQALLFSSLATKHERNRMLLWYPAQVRFKPVSTLWNFGDGTESKSLAVSHSWERSGTYEVKLTVDYSVNYRITGKSDWIWLPGTVRSSSDPITVRVGQPASTEKGNVVLVHWNCLQKQNAFGC